MKTRTIRILMLVVILAVVANATAQTTKKTTTKSSTTKSSNAKPATTNSAPVEVTIKLTSKCEKNVMMFAGSKTNLRDPKQREVGGLSVNTIYVKTGSVVCIMDEKKKPISCINVTKATTKLEINPSGTAFLIR